MEHVISRVGLPRSQQLLTATSKRKDKFKTMRKLFHILTLAAVLLTISVSGYSQVQPTSTTLSAAIADARATRMTVASATGFTASNSTIGNDYYAFIDHEMVRITAVSGTVISIQRGQLLTNATPHKSGAHVIVGVAPSQQGPATGQSGGPFIQNNLVGACTRSSYPILPLIQANANAIGGQAMYNCDNGVWLKQDLPDDDSAPPIVGACNIAIGSVAYASVGTNTTDIANKRMTTSLFVPNTGYYTGIQVLQGGTATTDKITAQIADASGKVIATGAAAGVSLSGANTFLPVPFALTRGGAAQTTTLLTGPAMYMVSIVGNGTAAGAYQTVPTATFKNIVSQGTTSITFGSFPDFVAPTTFTQDLAPIVCLYQ